MNLHIGILLSNTDRSEFALRYENDALKAATLLRRQRPDWEYSVYAAIDGCLPESPAAHDGYLVTGSPASVNGDEAWMPALFDFIRAASATTVPMVGLCFGHQAIAHALGGRVERAPAWGLGVATTAFHSPAQWMQPTRRELTLHAAHEDQVVELPDEGVALGGNDFCRYGAFSLGKHVFTTQYHPEFRRDFMTSLLAEKIGPHLDAEIVAKATDQLVADTHRDADIFAKWVALFFEQAQKR